jgi:ribosome-binding protein aMBF1 (putative translation factor)
VQKNLWTNEEFAKKLNEKESYISQILSGHMKPTLEVAKKIERMFDARLVESFDLSTTGNPASVTRGNSKSFDRMTFADVIKQAMEKKK